MIATYAEAFTAKETLKGTILNRKPFKSLLAGVYVEGSDEKGWRVRVRLKKFPKGVKRPKELNGVPIVYRRWNFKAEMYRLKKAKSKMFLFGTIINNPKKWDTKKRRIRSHCRVVIRTEAGDVSFAVATETSVGILEKGAIIRVTLSNEKVFIGPKKFPLGSGNILKIGVSF
jgi:hypothetical protein